MKRTSPLRSRQRKSQERLESMALTSTRNCLARSLVSIICVTQTF
jgi:ribosomal protein L32